METKRDHSYGVIPFFREGMDWKVFLIYQYGSAGDVFWTFPKGHPEPGETPEAAAKRELFEETGLRVTDLKAEPTIKQSYQFVLEGVVIDKSVTYFVGVTEAVEFTLQENEVKDAGWFTKEDALKQLTHDSAKTILLDAFALLNSTAQLYYDGDCAFCQACARLVKRFDTRHQIELRPLQGSTHDEPGSCYESILFIKGERQSQYSRAVIDVLKTMGGVWWLLGIVLWLVPRPVRDALYRFVGKRRHWFGGQAPRC